MNMKVNDMIDAEALPGGKYGRWLLNAACLVLTVLFTIKIAEAFSQAFL